MITIASFLNSVAIIMLGIFGIRIIKIIRIQNEDINYLIAYFNAIEKNFHVIDAKPLDTSDIGNSDT